MRIGERGETGFNWQQQFRRQRDWREGWWGLPSKRWTRNARYSPHTRWITMENHWRESPEYYYHQISYRFRIPLNSVWNHCIILSGDIRALGNDWNTLRARVFHLFIYLLWPCASFPVTLTATWNIGISPWLGLSRKYQGDIVIRLLFEKKEKKKKKEGKEELDSETAPESVTRLKDIFGN